MDRPGIGKVGLACRLDGEAAREEVERIACLALGGDEENLVEREFASEIEREPWSAGLGVDQAAAPADLLVEGDLGENGEVDQTAFQLDDLVFIPDQGAIEQAGDPADGIRRRPGRGGGEGVGE